MFCVNHLGKKGGEKEWQNSQIFSLHAKKLTEVYPCFPLEELTWHFPESRIKFDCRLLKCMFKSAVMQL